MEKMEKLSLFTCHWYIYPQKNTTRKYEIIKRQDHVDPYIFLNKKKTLSSPLPPQSGQPSLTHPNTTLKLHNFSSSRLEDTTIFAKKNVTKKHTLCIMGQNSKRWMEASSDINTVWYEQHLSQTSRFHLLRNFKKTKKCIFRHFPPANRQKCKKLKTCSWSQVRGTFTFKKDPGHWNSKTWPQYSLPLFNLRSNSSWR